MFPMGNVRQLRDARPRSTWRGVAACGVVAGLLGSLLLVGCEDAASRRSTIKAMVEEGRLEESVERLEEELADSPSDPELLYLYGITLLRLSKPSLALFPLLVARDHPDWETRAGLALIQVGIFANDREQAIEAASQVLETDPENEKARSLRADSLIQTKAYEAALEDANWLIDLDDENIPAHAMRLQALIGLRRMDEIEEDFDKLESMWKDEAFPKGLAERYCIARAVFASEKGETEKATTFFEDCLETFPNGSDILTAAVSFYDEQGNIGRATEILETALDRDPSAMGLREALAARLRGLGDADAAADLLLEATHEPGPAQGKAWLALAHHYFDLEAYDESVAAWKALFEIIEEPEDARLFGFAEALIHAQRFDEAEAVAARLPDSMSELVRGLAFLEKGEPEAALLRFDAGQRLWPNNAVARYFAGLAAERSFEIDRAIEEFRQSIRIDAEDTPAALRLARIYDAEGRIENARTALGHYSLSRPNDLEGNLMTLRLAAQFRGAQIIESGFAKQSWAVHELGTTVARVAEISMEMGDAQTTLRFLKSVSRLNFALPKNADAMRAFTDALVADGQAANAFQALDRALEAHPEAAAFHEIRGRILSQTGAAASAVRGAHERALGIDPDHARSLLAIGELVASEGNTQEARRLFERAVEENPKDPIARRLAAEWATRMGDLAAAEQHLTSLLDESPVDARAATQLAEVMLASGDDPARTARAAIAGVRFLGGSESFATLNRVYFAAGTPDQAIAILEGAVPLQGADPSLHYHLGEAQRAAGRPAEAMASFEKAVSLAAGKDFPERAAAEDALEQQSLRASAENSQ
jgi:tetratricopeptide (TPR) repeat protein